MAFRVTVRKAEPMPNSAASPGLPGMVGFPLQLAAVVQLPSASTFQTFAVTTGDTVSVTTPPMVEMEEVVPLATPLPVKMGVGLNVPVLPAAV